MSPQIAAALSLLILAGALASCMKGDEELHRQLTELRAAVDAKTKSVEQLESEMARLKSQKQPASLDASAASKEELEKAKARIAELEQRLATASPGPAAPPQLGRLDFDQIAGRLEEDLTRKARQLRELVQRQSPSSRIDEIALKSIEYPSQLITPFNSAITFTVTEGGAAPIRLMFPVTADLGGSWTLPTPDEIQKAYKAAQEQPRSLASKGTQPTQPAPPPASRQSQAAPEPSAGAGARMTQRADGVFVFDWGDAPAAAQPQQPQPSSTPPASPARAQTGTEPPPSAAPRPAAAPQAPSVPPPVMPIVGDRVIRFDD